MQTDVLRLTKTVILFDGDFLIAICANDMMKNGKLKKNTAVGTVMTNMGFSKSAKLTALILFPQRSATVYVL